MEYMLVPVEEPIPTDDDLVVEEAHYPDPIGPHYFEPYGRWKICGHRGCGASQRNAIHI